MQGKVFLPPIETKKRPMTLTEKIFARHMIGADGKVGVEAVKPGDSGFARTDLRFSHEYVTPMAAIFFDQFVGKRRAGERRIISGVFPRSPDVS